MKQLNCRDVGFDCEGVIRAESEDEILQQAGAHVQSVHNDEVTPELVARVRAAIRDVPGG